MKSRTATVLTVLCAAAALTACGDDEPAPKGQQVPVTATDTSCEVTTTLFTPGTVTFTVTNRGQQATGVYVYGREGDCTCTTGPACSGPSARPAGGASRSS
nr:hypothetical protein [Micromonospora provocatoris]